MMFTSVLIKFLNRTQVISKILFVLKLIFVLIISQFSFNTYSQITQINEIKGRISPKSIIHNKNGLFAAQNMMYRHSVTIYNQEGELLATVSDKINLKKFGFKEYDGDSYSGAPVEGVFTQDGKYLWVSNYNMTGKGFDKEGCDACSGSDFDPSFMYKISCKNFEIENVVKVGSVPKYVALNEDKNIMVVSNWSSADISIVDLTNEKEIKRVKVGTHPRGIEITKNGEYAYVTIMGSTKIAKVDLNTYEVDYIENIGKSPRHLVLDKANQYLYVSLNSSNQLAKINLETEERIYCKTSSGPRSMVLSENQKFLFVVNYFTDSFQKINAETMEVVETIPTGHHPIGITCDANNPNIWVACYEGKIQIFEDLELSALSQEELALQRKSTHASTLHQVHSNEKHEEVNIIEKEENPITTNQTVKTTKQEPKSSIVPKKTGNQNKICKHHLIVGSFSVSSNAENLSKEITKKGYQPELIQSSNKKMTMVSVACFESIDEAEKQKNKILNDLQKKGWIYSL